MHTHTHTPTHAWVPMCGFAHSLPAASISQGDEVHGENLLVGIENVEMLLGARSDAGAEPALAKQGSPTPAIPLGGDWSVLGTVVPGERRLAGLGLGWRGSVGCVLPLLQPAGRALF